MTTDLDVAWQRECTLQRDLVRLQLYHLFDRLRAGEVPAECDPTPPPGRTLFEFATAAWTSFYSYYFRNRESSGDHTEPVWLAFAERLKGVFDAGADLDLDALTEQAFPLLELEIAKRPAARRQHFGRPRPLGCFSYEYRPETRYVALHFGNAYAPESPFTNMGRLFASAAAIIDEVAERGYEVDRVGCDSWVNNLAPVQACFPPSFAASMTPTDPDAKSGYGWWGQFIDRTGALHVGRAALLKRTRQFKYRRMHAECGCPEFVEHVRNAPKTAI